MPLEQATQDERYEQATTDFGAALARLARSYEIDRDSSVTFFRRSISPCGAAWTASQGSVGSARGSTAWPTTSRRRTSSASVGFDRRRSSISRTSRRRSSIGCRRRGWIANRRWISSTRFWRRTICRVTSERVTNTRILALGFWGTFSRAMPVWITKRWSARGSLGRSMTSTAVALRDPLQQRLAAGHNDRREPVPNWDIPTLAGAGALRSTADDLLKLIAAELGYTASPLAPAMRSMLTVRRPHEARRPPAK